MTHLHPSLSPLIRICTATQVLRCTLRSKPHLNKQRVHQVFRSRRVAGEDSTQPSPPWAICRIHSRHQRRHVGNPCSELATQHAQRAPKNGKTQSILFVYRTLHRNPSMGGCVRLHPLRVSIIFALRNHSSVHGAVARNSLFSCEKDFRHKSRPIFAQHSSTKLFPAVDPNSLSGYPSHHHRPRKPRPSSSTERPVHRSTTFRLVLLRHSCESEMPHDLDRRTWYRQRGNKRRPCKSACQQDENVTQPRDGTAVRAVYTRLNKRMLERNGG